MQPEVVWLGLSPSEWTAIATVTNAVLVIVLAIINFRYMRSASEQAKASTKQATAAFANIDLLKNQIQDQTLLKRTETLIDLRRMNMLLASWAPKLSESWGQLPPFEGLLPDNWPSIVFVVERNIPNQKENLKSIETHITNAEMLIKDHLARAANYRQADVMKAAANDLNEASRPLGEILLALENHKLL
jgi:hypothetical protein